MQKRFSQLYRFLRSCCKYKIICFSLKDFRQQSPTRARSGFQRGQYQLPLNLYIQSNNKRELVNLYREDFKSILRKQRPFPFFANH